MTDAADERLARWRKAHELANEIAYWRAGGDLAEYGYRLTRRDWRECNEVADDLQQELDALLGALVPAYAERKSASNVKPPEQSMLVLEV